MRPRTRAGVLFRGEEAERGWRMHHSSSTSRVKLKRSEAFMTNVESVKVVLLGDSGVGKSSLCLQFVTNQFRPYSEATIGASFMSKTIIISGRSDDLVNVVDTAQLNAVQVNPKERQIGFKIWDTAGQEKYRSLAPMYYRGSQAAILVYDITKPASLESLKDWADELRRNGPSDLVLAVCGNKLDLQEDRLVMRSAGEKYAKQIGALYVETSAKEGDDVERLFVEIARKVPLSKPEDDYLAEDLDLSKPVVKSGGCC